MKTEKYAAKNTLINAYNILYNAWSWILNVSLAHLNEDSSGRFLVRTK